MNKSDLKNIVEKLINTFIYAGKISLDLRKKGLIKKIKSDNTRVSNGDLEVNRIITEKIIEITPEIPISFWSYKALTLCKFETPPDAIMGISIDFANFFVCNKLKILHQRQYYLY